MKTHTLLFVSIALFFAVSLSNSLTRTAQGSNAVNMSAEAEEALTIEGWMVSESFWGIEKNTSFVFEEEPEATLEIEKWMYDNEYWGLS